LDLGRIVEIARGQLDPARIGAGLGDRDQDAALLLGIALHRLDEIGNEVGAALIIGLEVAPGRVNLLLRGRDAVEPAAGEAERGERCKQTKTAKCGHRTLQGNGALIRCTAVPFQCCLNGAPKSRLSIWRAYAT